MPLADELQEEVAAILRDRFDISAGWAIPSLGDVPFDNAGKRIRLFSLFVDIRRSTDLVTALGLETSARMYKAYLRGVTRIVRHRGGQVLSFNGDGIVAGFVGSSAANAAVLSALNINWFNHHILGPYVMSELANLHSALVFDWGIGIDAGNVLVVKSGMRGADNSDLVWAGNPVNFSAKINSKASAPWNLYVSEAVHSELHSSLTDTNGTPIWEPWIWMEKGMTLWRSRWSFTPAYVAAVPSRASLLSLLENSPAPRERSVIDLLYPSGTMADLVNPSFFDYLRKRDKPTK
jgi:adenylate cyclase